MIEKGIKRKDRYENCRKYGKKMDKEIELFISNLDVGDSFIAHAPSRQSWENKDDLPNVWSQYYMNRAAHKMGFKLSYDHYSDGSFNGHWRVFRIE